MARHSTGDYPPDWANIARGVKEAAGPARWKQGTRERRAEWTLDNPGPSVVY